MGADVTIDELRELCAHGEHVLLTIPRDRLPRGHSVRLVKIAGPIGRICTVKEHGDGFAVIACFKSAEIVAWLNKEEAARDRT